MVAAPRPQSARLLAQLAAADDALDPDRGFGGTWGEHPDRYIRQVKGGKFQARPHDSLTGERDNLGLFQTRREARKAIGEYWAGLRKGRPKFVRACPHRGGMRYFVLVPSAGPTGRTWVRVGEWFATEEEAGAAASEYLIAVYGKIAAEALLSRRDSSQRSRHRPRSACT